MWCCAGARDGSKGNSTTELYKAIEETSSQSAGIGTQINRDGLGPTASATSQTLAASALKTSSGRDPEKTAEALQSSEAADAKTFENVTTDTVTNVAQIGKAKGQESSKLVEEDRLTDAQAAVLVNEPDTKSAAKSEGEEVEVGAMAKAEEEDERGIADEYAAQARKAEAETDHASENDVVKNRNFESVEEHDSLAANSFSSFGSNR